MTVDIEALTPPKLVELPELDRKVALLMAQGHDDSRIAEQLVLAEPTVARVLRTLRDRVRKQLQRTGSQKVTRLEMALYVLQFVITVEERKAWIAEAEARVKLLRDCNLLDERAYLTARRAAEPRNFGLTFVALARVTGRYNGKLVRQILEPLWQALGCGPIGLRTTFYLVALYEGQQQPQARGAYQTSLEEALNENRPVG